MAGGYPPPGSGERRAPRPLPAGLRARGCGKACGMVDAIVIGSGHNGLVAANLLADEGWDVLVLEGEATHGGAVRTTELVEPGFRNDVFSAFYPLSIASP